MAFRIRSTSRPAKRTAKRRSGSKPKIALPGSAAKSPGLPYPRKDMPGRGNTGPVVLVAEPPR